MKAACCVSLAVALTLAAAGRGAAADEKPPDYSRKTMAEWIAALKDQQDGKLAKEAQEALGPNGPYAKAAIPALIAALDEEDAAARAAVVEVLAEHGPAVVPGLLRALKRSEVSVRIGAARALGAVRPRAVEAAPALIGALKDKDPDVRRSAVGSLGTIRRPFDKTVPALAAALRDDNDSVRYTAFEFLRMMGRKAAPAVPALITALKDKQPWAREKAAWGLAMIGPDARAAVPALIDALRDKENASERKTIAWALGSIGPAANGAVPALLGALQERDSELAPSAAMALGQIGPGARAAVPELLKLAKDKKCDYRAEAIRALGRIGPDARAAVPTLIEALGDSQESAAEALGGMGPDAKAAVPALMALARDLNADAETREAAARAVIRIDPELAAKEKMESAYLNVRLGKVPSVKLEPRAAATEEQKKRIKGLIAKLAEIKHPDFGMSASLTGEAFAPVSGQEHAGMLLLTDHGLKTSDAFRSLVAMGPEALPFLLAALEDKTPTKLKVERRVGPLFMGGGELSGNPLNALEWRVLSREAVDDDDDEEGLLWRPYTLKVGDVCFVAIGQIVGRSYRAVRYQPTAMVIINSAAGTKDLRERVRAIWSSNEPARKLLDSLLIDFATGGRFNGKSLDGWYEGSDRQIQAALRLLYYFPKETAPLIAARLRSFDVKRVPESKDWMTREVKNGVRTVDFIKAVSWCKAPGIQEALADVARRTDDPDIKEILPSGKK